MPRDLLIGCGAKRDMRVSVGERTTWGDLVTLDNVASHKPDVLHDLREPRLPFDDDSFDSLHAYEVLEHIGQQGDAEAFFRQFSDYWRVLKPGGVLCGTCPSLTSRWLWGDPSHTRVIAPESFTFLVQPEYTKQIGKTAMSDFRHIYKADFDIALDDSNGQVFLFRLTAVKPSRISI